MGRRASSSVNPAWFAIAAAVVIAAIVGGWMTLKSTVADPFRTLAPFPTADYLQNSNSLRGNTYKLDCVVGEQLRYVKNARVFSVDVNGEPVSVVLPPGLRGENVQKGQRLLFKVEVDEKGVLRVLGVKKV